MIGKRENLTITLGPFSNSAQKNEALLKILELTDADEGKERRADKPLTMRRSGVCLSCQDTQGKIMLEMEGPMRQLSQAQSKISAIVKSYNAPVLLSPGINQEHDHGNPR